MSRDDIPFDTLRKQPGNSITEVVGSYLELTRRGSEWKASCPFHADGKTPNLCVVPSKGKAFCLSCGWHGDVFDFIADFENLTTQDGRRNLRAAAERLGHLPTDRPPPPPAAPDESDRWQPILPAPADAPAYDPGRTWNPRSVDRRTGAAGRYVDWNRSRTRLDTYRSPTGATLGHVVRLEFDGTKLPMTVTYCQHADTGERRWCAVKFPTPRPLYGLDELAARPDAKVMVVSSEKCKEAGARALPGFVVVTWPGGDQNVGRADWTPLYGRNVTFWPDLDRQASRAGDLLPYDEQSGVVAMRAAAAILAPHGGPLRELDLREDFGWLELPNGWDVADAVAPVDRGGNGWDSATVVEFCRKRVRDYAPPPAPGAGSDEDAGVTPQRCTDDREAASGPAPGKVNGSAHHATDATARADDDIPVPRAGHDPDDEYARLFAARDAERDRAVHAFLTSPVEPEFFEDVELGPLPGSAPSRIQADLRKTTDPNVEDTPARYSEDNVALLMAEGVRDQFRYVPGWGRWMWWDDNRWTEDNKLRAFDASRRFCRFAGAAAERDLELTPAQRLSVQKTYGQSSTVASVERLAKADQRLAATTEQWDADLWALNTPTGIVDLRTGRIRTPGRTDYMTKITRVGPSHEGCPTWHRFLETSTGGDRDLIGFLQRVAGYCLTGSVRDQALFFVYGTGGNGKGTFLNTLTHILNDYASVAGIDTFTESKHDRHTTELARLRGARFVTAQEVEEGKRWAEAKIKALTGGDPITARFMRQDDFTFLPQFKLVIAGNHKPGLRNVDEAIKRRLHLIPFTITIAPQDRDQRLSEKLIGEAGAILQWAIDGCLAWQRDGLQPPASVRAATAEYLDQQDTLGAWLHERCRFAANVAGSSASLYDSFRRWAERHGEYVLPQKRWVAAMESRGYASRRAKSGTVFDGVEVVFDPERDAVKYPGDEPPPDLLDSFVDSVTRQ
jgi:P4 family phage/plasmid primase-like protien